jgi:hypothetical protein
MECIFCYSKYIIFLPLYNDFLFLVAVEAAATAQAAEVHVVHIQHTRAEVGVAANLVPDPAQS